MSRALPPLYLTREAILNGSMRALVQAADPAVPVLSPEEHDASIQALLDERRDSRDVWIFAYGSLMWNPLIHYAESRVGTAHGYHRCFCLWTHIGRGTAAKPGLMLGLEKGGACRGVIYRLDAAAAVAELEILWRREMVTGAYAPRWVTVATEGETVRAIAFLINRAHPRYAGRLSEDRVVSSIAEARGPLGPCAAYLFNTVAHLEELGVRDRRLSQLRNRVAAKMAERDQARS